MSSHFDSGGELFTPLTGRETTFLDVTVQAQKERDAARKALEEVVRLIGAQKAGRGEVPGWVMEVKAVARRGLLSSAPKVTS